MCAISKINDIFKESSSKIGLMETAIPKYA